MLTFGKILAFRALALGGYQRLKPKVDLLKIIKLALEVVQLCF
jgi:hypothetical protein